MIVIGSLALMQYGLLDRVPGDIDYLMTMDDLYDIQVNNKGSIRHIIPVSSYKYTLRTQDGKQYDIALVDFESDHILIRQSEEWELTYTDSSLGIELKVPPLIWLYHLKKAHIHCDVKNFDKNIVDYHAMRRELMNTDGFEESPVLEEFYRQRRTESEKIHRYRVPSLDMTNDEFFEGSSTIVGYEFVHDDLHEALKHGDEPVYMKMKKDQSRALCDRELFDELEHEEKIQSVLEEAYVIATERYLLKGDMSPMQAFLSALRRICTTLCSGFFRKFAVEHYFEIIVYYDNNYPKKVTRAYQNGNLRPLQDVSIVESAVKTLKGNMTTY